MTPNDLDVLIHYATLLGPHPRVEAPAVQDAITRFIEDGIMIDYKITEKGNAWLRLILSTPYPVNQWCDPRTLEKENPMKEKPHGRDASPKSPNT